MRDLSNLAYLLLEKLFLLNPIMWDLMQIKLGLSISVPLVR
jgi:hypothetical protein